MADYDGYVRINAKLDDAQVLKQMSGLARQINRQTEELEKAKARVAQLREEYDKLYESERQKATADLRTQYDAEIEKIRQLSQEYKAAADERDRLAKVRETIERANGTPTQAFLDKEAANADEISRLARELGEAKQRATELHEAMANAKFDENSSEALKKAKENIRLADEHVNRLSADLENSRQAMAATRSASEGIDKPLEKASKASSTFANRIQRMARTALVFYAFRRLFMYIRNTILSLSGLSVVTGVFTEFNTKMKEAYQSNVQVQTALASLRGALYAAFAPIYSAVVPALVALVNWLTRAVYAIASFFSALTGGSLKTSTEQANKLAGAVGGVGGAAKEANKQLAQFDKLNTLSEDKGGGGGGGGGSTPTFDNDFEENKIAQKIGSIMRKIRQTIMDNLAAFDLILGASEFAIGAVLTFSGANVPIGLALMALGARRVYKSVTEDWGSISPKVQEAVAEILAIVATALTAIGLILLLTSHVGLGLGLIVAGLGTYAALAVNWNNLTDTVRNKVSDLLTYVGFGLMGIGLVLLLAHNIPLGIGLMLAGGLASMAGASQLNWNTLATYVRNNLGKILLIASGALLALGLILVLSCPALIPLGIGLMMAGGLSGLGGLANVNWDGLKLKLQGAWQSIKDWFQTHVAQYLTREYWQEKINRMFDIIAPHIPMPHVEVSWIPAGGLAQFFGISQVPSLNVRWYAQGGFPDAGSLFVAGEAGPELVGSFGSHNNSVINEAQLVQAFQSATSEQVSLLRQQNSLLMAILEKSGTVTFKPSAEAGRAFSKSINLYARATGG